MHLHLAANRLRIGFAFLLWLFTTHVLGATQDNSSATQARQTTWAQRWTEMVPKNFKNRPEFTLVKDDPALPRVLLIGDSISIGYTVPVRKLLKGKANVHRIPINGQTTSYSLKHLSAWLGDVPWDVIHFNWGIHDLSNREQMNLKPYERNLEKLVRQLKATGATLIWASTTPIPAGVKASHEGWAVFYNEVARKVMARHNVPINDLHAFALPQLDQIQKPANVHFTPAGSAVLGSEVAKHILAALDTRAARKPRGAKHPKAPFRVLYSNDLTNVLTCVSPYHKANEPFRREMIAAAVDESVEAGADVHMLQPGLTFVPLWKSNLYPADEHLRWYQSTFKGPISSYLQYVVDGGDIVDVFVKQCRKRSIAPFVSLRMNDWHGLEWLAAKPGATLNEFASITNDRWRREHPEYWLTKPSERTPVPPEVDQSPNYVKALRRAVSFTKLRDERVPNWGAPEVPERVLTFVREICEGYDIDGLELDFMRHTRSFRLDETTAQQRIAIVTEFVRQVRQLLDRTSRPGQRRWLCMRIPAIVDGHAARGIDVKKLVDVGLDMINLSNNYYTVQTTDLARIREMVPQTAVYLEMHYCTTVENVNGRRTKRFTTDEQFQTTAHLAYTQGAQGVSLFNFQYYRAWKNTQYADTNRKLVSTAGTHTTPPGEPPFHVLKVLADPDLLAPKPQHYFLTPGWSSYLRQADENPPHVRLMMPGALKPGKPQKLIMNMEPPPGGWQQNGKLRIQSARPFEDVSIIMRINSVLLEATNNVVEPYPNPYPVLLGTPETLRAWIVPPSILRRGANEIEITLEQGPSTPLTFVDLALP